MGFLYLAYRVSFSYMILMDSKNYPEKKSAMFYVKESFFISKGVKIFKFILFLILFTLIMLPFDYIGNYVETHFASFIFIYGIILFVILGNIFEMYVISIYRRVMLEHQPLKIEELKKEVEEEIL